YRSLYWRIALGYIAMLALLLLVQTSLAVWMTGRVWGRASRTPAQLADLVAQDLAWQLEHGTGAPDLNDYLLQKYGRGYQPFVVVLRGSEETFSNRPTVLPPNLGREARRVLFGAQNPEFDRERFGRGGGGRGRRPFAEYADILVNGDVMGIVAVPST